MSESQGWTEFETTLAEKVKIENDFYQTQGLSQFQIFQLKLETQLKKLSEKLVIKNIYVRRFLAECYGTFLLHFFVASISASTTCYSKKYYDVLVLNFINSLGTVIGLFLAIISASSISGSIFNPAVTFYFWFYGGLRWWEVLYYWFAQCLGSYVACALVYVQYLTAIETTDPDKSYTTAAIFTSIPQDTMTIGSSFYSSMICTIGLLLIVQTTFDPRQGFKGRFGQVAVPVVNGIGIANAFGYQSSNINNPALDLMGRIWVTTVGYGTEVWYFPPSSIVNYLYESVAYFWIPVVAPFCGAIFTGAFYKFFIGHHLPKIIDNDVEAMKKTEKISILGNQRPHLEKQRISRISQLEDYARRRSSMLPEGLEVHYDKVTKRLQKRASIS